MIETLSGLMAHSFPGNGSGLTPPNADPLAIRPGGRLYRKSAAPSTVYGAATIPRFDTRAWRANTHPVLIDTHFRRLDTHPRLFNPDVRRHGARSTQPLGTPTSLQ